MLDDGTFGFGQVKVEGGINFNTDIDKQEEYSQLISGATWVYYISPSSTAVEAEEDTPEPVAIENLPEFMEFEGKTKSNLPAYDSAVIPLTPQVATVNSMGTFKCRVEKAVGRNLLDQVTNVMEATRFRWEVLKLDEQLHVVNTKSTSGWDSAGEEYRRRFRNLDADRKTLEGDPK